VAKMRKFGLGNAEEGPAVILTREHHKEITATLATETGNAETPAQLWEGYKKAYEKYPAWLAEIERYFAGRK